MVNAREWLDKNYPKKERNEVKKLDISNRRHELTGSLNLEGFDNLEELDCS